MFARSVLSAALALAGGASQGTSRALAPWLILGGIALLYAALIAAWRWVAHRWGLAGARAPPRAILSRNEYLARRSLRALLAFDFLVILPIFVPSSVAILSSAIEDPRGLPPEVALSVMSLLMFLAPVPVLRRSIRRMEQQRLAGQVVQDEPLPSTSGLAELDVHLRRAAWGTRLVAGLIVLVSVAAFADQRLAAALLKDRDAILAGQAWRLLTVALVHANLLHLAFNVSVLVSAGSLLERLAGTRWMLLVQGAGTLVGSLCSVALLPGPGVGASGGVLAVAAAVATFGLRHRALFPPTARARLFRASVELVALNAVLTFVLPNVDWAAHVGGLLAGAVLGWLATPARGTIDALAASQRRPAEAAVEPPPLPPPTVD